jgi:hypothetical protein
MWLLSLDWPGDLPHSRTLAFANHMNRFVTGDGAPRTPERPEMLARVDPTLNRPVILFQDVIEILHGAVLAIVGQIACGLEHGNGGWISSVLVAVDDPRRGMVLPAQGFGQKALGGRGIAFGREKEVDRRTGGVHGPVQVHPFAFHPHVRLVHPPRVVCGLEPFAQAPIHSGAYRWTQRQTVT